MLAAKPRTAQDGAVSILRGVVVHQYVQHGLCPNKANCSVRFV
jgi:hypothetical protein